MSTIPDAFAAYQDGGVELGGDYATPAPEKAKEATPDIEVVSEQPEEAAEEAVEAVADEAEEGEEGGQSGKGRDRPAVDRIKELYKQKRELERALDRATGRAEALEGRGKLPGDERMLQPDGSGGNNVARVAPDPTDLSTYPLGALDDRYVEDKIAFGIESALGSVLQRQQENAQQAEAQRVQTENLKRAETVVAKGREIHDDYDEVVWEAGKRGEYRMDEPTFNALTEAEHGAEIAYALASNKAEAARVAGLSPYGQVAYVAQKNAEFAARKAVKLPKAGSPPVNTARGTGGSKSTVAHDTEDLGAVKRMLLG